MLNLLRLSKKRRNKERFEQFSVSCLLREVKGAARLVLMSANQYAWLDSSCLVAGVMCQPSVAESSRLMLPSATKEKQKNEMREKNECLQRILAADRDANGDKEGTADGC